MDLGEQISIFQEFIEKEYYDSLISNIRNDKHFLVVDFSLLSMFNPDLAQILLEQPEDTIKAAEKSIEGFDIKINERIHVRFKNLPNSQKITIRNIRSQHINKLLEIEGIVRQKTDVRPQVISARFECPSCGNIIPVLQLEEKFREPISCGCGRKGKFRLLSKKLVDTQRMILEENPKDFDGGEQPKRFNILLKHDLVSPMSEKKTNPGSGIKISGMIKELPITLNQGGQSTRFDLILEANFVEALEEDYSQINISPEEEEEIKKLSKDPAIFQKLVNSLAPNIYGHEKIKEALLMQLAGGVMKRRSGSKSRGDIHILLIGDPGSGKSQLIKRVSQIAPKGRFVSGKGASGAGLTASVVRDEFLKGWALEAGALVLANKGLCAIDELDKMTTEDRSAMHEALEQQTVTIAKANIQATLRSETSVLAAANPKFGRFDPYELIAKQIDLPNTLINRFDLIFPVRDLPNKITDDKLATFLLNLHKQKIDTPTDIDEDLMKKYVAFVRMNSFPELTTEAINEIKAYYLKMRGSGEGEGADNIKAIPISARQLEALVRLSEASAKIRLSSKVTKRDARIAVDLLHYCLSKIGIDPDTGKIDIDRLTTGITAKQRSTINTVKEIINNLESTVGKVLSMDDIVREAEINGVNETQTREIIDKLKRSGDLFSPREGFISKI